MSGSARSDQVVEEFADFIAGLDQDERRAFNCITERFEGETFTTMKVGEQLSIPVDSRGNGREWLSKFIARLVAVRLEVPLFDRYPEDKGKGTPHPGYVGPLAVVAPGYTKHRPYMLAVPKYVLKQAMRMLGDIPVMQAIDAELLSIEQRTRQLQEQRAAVIRGRSRGRKAVPSLSLRYAEMSDAEISAEIRNEADRIRAEKKRKAS